MAKPFIIKIKHGGLGDHLFFSHLPRIAKTVGGAPQVLISNLTEYRHPDYRRLIWEANPYVDGFTDQDPPELKLGRVPQGMNLLDLIMLAQGLDDGQRYHEPELYFPFTTIPSLAGANVYDPNYITNAGDLNVALLENYFHRNNILVNHMLSPRSPSLPLKNVHAVLTTKNLEDYCSIIKSCGRFFCLTSGGATLAAALGVPATVLWGHGVDPAFHHSKRNQYINLNPPSLSVRCRETVRGLVHGIRKSLRRC